MQANQVWLLGYVGQDLAERELPSGSKLVRIRVATHRKRRAQDGSRFYITDWHDVVAWGRKAAYAANNFVKGSHILVTGRIVYRTWLDRTGHMRYVTEVRADQLVNLDR